jgi:hypothetical protein
METARYSKMNPTNKFFPNLALVPRLIGNVRNWPMLILDRLALQRQHYWVELRNSLDIQVRLGAIIEIFLLCKYETAAGFIAKAEVNGILAPLF